MSAMSRSWRSMKNRFSSLKNSIAEKSRPLLKKASTLSYRAYKTCHIALCEFIALFPPLVLTKAYLVIAALGIDDSSPADPDMDSNIRDASPRAKFAHNILGNFFYMPVLGFIGGKILSFLSSYISPYLNIPSWSSHVSSFVGVFQQNFYISGSFWSPLITICAWIYYGVGTLYALTIGAISRQFTLSENMSTWQHVLTIGEIIAADCLHILPLLVLTFYVALALPESPFLLMGTLGFCSAYRTLFLLNIILSGADLKELPNLPEESSTASDAFDSAPPKFEGQEATTKRAFLGKIYNWSTWKKLSDSNIDPYSSLIYIPLENYFFIAQLYKGIHMLITAPLVVADFLALSAQNAGKVQSTFTGAIKRTGHTAFDFAKRADNTFMPSRYSFFGKQEISQRPQRAYQLSSAYYTDSAQKLPTHSMSPAL